MLKKQATLDVEASALVRDLHDALQEECGDGNGLELFLARLVFWFFADSTRIFKARDSFADLLRRRTRTDGTDLGRFLAEFSEILSIPPDRGPATRRLEFEHFPCIDVDLFKARLPVHSFSRKMRRKLLSACGFDWSRVSVANFGSLFQVLLDRGQRRARGAHYTTENNILRVIEPLFLDNLRNEFEQLKSCTDSRLPAKLRAFRRRLGNLDFFDPACGCGNFLVIAYRELRRLEIEVIRELRAYEAVTSQRVIDAPALSLIDVDQFFGIEIGELPVRIAETALWMMDHLMNNRLSLEFGQTCARMPLRTASRIVHGDALELDWGEVLAAERCSYVFGNPPFVGAKYQTAAQRAQVRRIAALGHNGGTLDYVAAWFVKAADYARRGGARIGFVATNSLTQGEQVSQLWPQVFERYGMELTFAHRTLAWDSDAPGMAHVHVVLIGLAASSEAAAQKRLFRYDDLRGEPRESRHAALSPYLIDADRMPNPHIAVRETASQISGLPPMRGGSQPIDGGNYIFDEAGREKFLAAEPRGGAVPATLRRGAGLPAWGEALDPRLAGGGARRPQGDAGGSGKDAGGPRVPEAEQAQEHAGHTRRPAQVQRRGPTSEPLPRHPGGELGATPVRADRLAGAADHPQQSRAHRRERITGTIRPADLRHAYDLAPPCRQEA